MQEPSHQQVLEFLRENPKPFATSSDVSERFDSVSGRTIRKRLNDLAKSGQLEKTEVGANGVVWWVPNYGPDSAR